jgi:hypothetical protein
MKNSKSLLALGVSVVSLLTTTGCSDNSSTQSITQSETVMELNTPYTVNEGDTLINEGNAKVEVTHLVSSNTKQVKIISGSAKLLR